MRERNRRALIQKSVYQTVERFSSNNGNAHIILRRRKRPLRSRNYSQRNIESVVKIEPLLSLYPDTDEQVPFKTKTTWNKYHKQVSGFLHTSSLSSLDVPASSPQLNKE